MKIIILAENFKKGISIADKIVGKNLTLPILSNILLEAEKGRLRASATNLEIGVVCGLRAKIEKEGKIAIPARILSSFLAGVPDNEKILIETKDGILKISFQGSKSSIKGMDAQDFPLIPRPKENALFDVRGDLFKEAVQKTALAAATNETRQELTGVYVQFFKNKLVFAATDSFRLSEYVIELKKDDLGEDYEKFVEKNNAVIVPVRTMQEVARGMDGAVSQNVKVYMGESQIFFEANEVLYVSRLIDGKYPEYKQVVPKEYAFSFLVNRNELLKAVKSASIFSDSKSREIRIQTTSGEKKIQIGAQSVESGENSTEVSVNKNINKAIEIAFNGRYLTEGLGSSLAEFVFFGFNDSFGPVALREIEKNEKINDKYLHIIMPIRS